MVELRLSPASITRGVAALPSYTSLRIGPLFPDPWPGTPTKTNSCDSEMQLASTASHQPLDRCVLQCAARGTAGAKHWVLSRSRLHRQRLRQSCTPQSRGQLLTFSAIFPPSGLGAFYKSRGSSSFLAFSLASYHTIQIQSTQKSTSTQLQDDFIIIQPVAILSAIVAITTQRPNTTTSPLPHTTLLHHGAYASPLKIIFHLLSQQVQSQP